MTMPVPALVDVFVERINTGPREGQPLDEVPASLREPASGRRFPQAFLDLVSRFSFPASEHGPLLFFANHREETFWDLSRRLFLDPTMSPALLSAGFIQIGNPYFYNYDPICFDCNLGATERRLVQLNHEAILCDSRIQIVREIAPSFIDLLDGAIE